MLLFIAVVAQIIFGIWFVRSINRVVKAVEHIASRTQ